MFKRIFIGIGLLFALLLAALFILPTLVPTDSYRAQLEGELSRSFARDVSIEGDINLKTFPAIEIETGAINLANPDGFARKNLIEMEGLTARVRLWPLLKKRVEISRIDINAPDIWLERKTDGSENWTSPNAIETTPAEPFSRDGRLIEYDPALALFRIKEGRLRFQDPNANRDVTLSNINMDLNAPGLDKPLNLEGSLSYNDLPLDISGKIQTPKTFLNGSLSPFTLDLISDVAEIKMKGNFREAEAIAFDAQVDAKSSKPNDISKHITLPSDFILPVLKAVSVTADVSFDGETFSAANLRFNANSDVFTIGYTGALNLSEALTANGKFDLSLSDSTLINDYVDQPISALEMIETLNTNGDLQLSDGKIDIKSFTATTKGDDLTGTFTGDISANESGITVLGHLDVSIADMASFVKSAGLEQADAAALGRVNATGKLEKTLDHISLIDLTATATDGLANGSFEGDINSLTPLTLTGDIKTDITSLSAVDAALPREIPYSNLIGEISVSTQVKTNGNIYELTELTTTFINGQINGEFTGSAKISETQTLDGSLKLDIPNLRRIAESSNVALPPSTEAGSIFDDFRVAGNVSGTPEFLKFSSGTLEFDKLSGKGDFNLELIGDRPRLTGELALDSLDLRPYMAAWSAQRPKGKIIPWSTKPLNITGLNAIDSELKITAPAIKLTRLEFGQTQSTAILQNGVLNIDIPMAGLYGGSSLAKLTLDASNEIPQIQFDAQVKAVTAKDFLLASGNFDKVTGTADLIFSTSGAGQSQADMMKSLSGKGNFSAQDGSLLGINAEALLTGIDQAITERRLPQGLGLGETTRFNDIIGNFSITNGRFNIGKFALEAGNFSMEGDGLIDLGAQNLDFGLRPKLKDGSDAASFGVPLRFQGTFGQAKAQLDTEMLSKIAAAKARQSAGDVIRDSVSGPLGDILGGVIGGTAPASENQPEPTETPKTPIVTESETPSESPDTPAETPPQADEAKPPSNSPEEAVNDLLNDLFGSKKKEKKSD